jgi:hypothetical protein
MTAARAGVFCRLAPVIGVVIGVIHSDSQQLLPQIDLPALRPGSGRISELLHPSIVVLLLVGRRRGLQTRARNSISLPWPRGTPAAGAIMARRWCGNE